MSFKLYKSKTGALGNLGTNQILCNKSLTRYFVLGNHEEYLKLIKNTKDPEYFEYIPGDRPVKLFFDIDIKETDKDFAEPYKRLDQIKQVFGSNYILLESHCEYKRSFHMIYPEHICENISKMKELVKNKKINTDYSVYRVGLFRTIYSNKPEESRPFVYDNMSPMKDCDLSTFVTHIPKMYEISQSSSEVCNVVTSSSSNLKVVKGCDFREINKVMGRPDSETWDIIKTANGVKAIPNGSKCLVDPMKDHHPNTQSALFVNNNETSVCSCFGNCGHRTLNKKECKEVIHVFNMYLNIREDTSRYQNLQNELIRKACENNYKREENTGVVYKPIRPYAYIRYKEPQKYLNEIFIRNKEFKSHVNNMEHLIKFMKSYDDENFKFLEVNKDYLGFRNGVLNIVTCEFTEIGPKDMIVRKYFDKEFTGKTETPLMDKILDYQFASEVRDFIYMSLGRCFGIRDNLGYMLYLLGESGCGKSVIINIMTECFNKIGAIGSSYEETFGLSFLYNKDIVVCDDLPKHISKLFPQQTFQVCVTGGTLPIAVKGGEGFSTTWEVPMLWAGNWFPDYICKGQIARRIVTANFEKIVENPDCNIESNIKSNELPEFIYKCVLYYKRLLDSGECNDIWKVCPEYFIDQKEDLKIERNPLYKYLLENTMYKENEIIQMEEIRDNFANWLGSKVIKLDHGTIKQVDNRYIIKVVKLCKHCMKVSHKDCCELYSHKDRTKKAVVENLKITYFGE
jgi:phage/plasmid-associated DNA primase